MMRTFALPVLLMLLLLSPATNSAAAPSMPVSAVARQPLVLPGERITYDVRLESAGSMDGAVAVELAVLMHPDFRYVPGSTSSHGVAAVDPERAGSILFWADLPVGSRLEHPFGVHTFVQDTLAGPVVGAQLDWSRALSGPGGYVKQLFYPVRATTQGPEKGWVEFVAAAYDRDLIPVLRLQGGYDPENGRWSRPDQDPDGSYASIAEAFRRVVAGLPRRDGRPIYIEVWNEPNIDADWGGETDPVEYARFLLEVSDALRSLDDPRVVILNAGLAPGGNYSHLDFIDAMFTAVPRAAHAFDVWASHPYAGNHPPEYDDTYYSIHGYRWELERLARYRDTGDLKVMATEGGYALGNQDNPDYPPIDEDRRSEYTRRAFQEYWLRDDRLLAVMPFQLSDPFEGWSQFDWVHPHSETGPDGSPEMAYPVYRIVKELAKPRDDVLITFQLAAPSREGTYQPTVILAIGGALYYARGEAVTVARLEAGGVLSGSVTLEGRQKHSGARVTVGENVVETGDDGSYHVAVPAGSHSVSIEAEGFAPVEWNDVPVTRGARTTMPSTLLAPSKPAQSVFGR
jgi:hypothetical protein